MVAGDFTIKTHAACNGAHLGNLEGLADFEVGDNLLLRLGREHTLDSVLQLVDGVVDDTVETDVDLLGLGHLAGTHGGTHLEAYDDSVGRLGKEDVVLGNLTDGLVDDIDLHLVSGEFQQRVGEGFDRTVDITLDDNIEFLEVANGDTAANLVEGHVLLGAETLLALQLCTLGGDVLGFLLAFGDVEGVACLTGACETKEKHGLRGTGGHNLLVTLVVHGADTSADGTGNDGVAFADSTVFDKQFGDVATTFVERALQDCTLGTLVGVALQLHDVGLKDNLLQQFLDIDTLLG